MITSSACHLFRTCHPERSRGSLRLLTTARALTNTRSFDCENGLASESILYAQDDSVGVLEVNMFEVDVFGVDVFGVDEFEMTELMR